MAKARKSFDPRALVEAARRGGADWDLIEAAARASRGRIPIRLVREIREEKESWQSQTLIRGTSRPSTPRTKQGRKSTGSKRTKPRKRTPVPSTRLLPRKSRKPSKATAKHKPRKPSKSPRPGRKTKLRVSKSQPKRPRRKKERRTAAPAASAPVETPAREETQAEREEREFTAKAREIRDKAIALAKEAAELRKRELEIKREQQDLLIEYNRTWSEEWDWLFDDAPLLPERTKNGYAIPDPDYMLDMADELDVDVSDLYDAFYGETPNAGT